MKFFERASQSKRVLLFHLGSADVSASIIEVSKETNTPVVHATVASSKKGPLPATSDELVSALTRSIAEVSEKILTSRGGSFTEIVCVLGTPWYTTHLRTIRMSKTRPFQVTQKLISELVKKEIDIFSREEIAPYQGGSRPVIIEEELDHVLVNGYAVTDPYKDAVQDIELSLAISVAPEAFLGTVNTAIRNAFHRDATRFASAGYIGSLVMRDLFAYTPDFVLVDIGGMLTDITIVRDGKLTGNASFPFGADTLSALLASSLGKSQMETQSLLSIHLAGDMTSQASREIVPALDIALAKWTTYFEQALVSLARTFVVPSTVICISTSEYTELFRGAINNESLAQLMFMGKKFSALSVTDTTLKPFITSNHSVNPRMAIGSLVVHKKYQNEL